MKKLRQPTSLHCFACGKDNPFGLHLEWFNDYENKRVETTFTLGDNYCSYPGTVHGGIIATILDETSGRAVLLNNDFNNLMVTLKMEVTYKKNTPTNTPLRAIGRLIKGGPSHAKVEGEIVLPDGIVSATCTSILFKIPQAVKDKWGPEAQEWARTTPQIDSECACACCDEKPEK